MDIENLEQKLLQNNWLPPERLEAAKQEAAKTHKSIWAALVKLGYISLDGLSIFFAQESGVPYVKISDYKINTDVLRLIDENVCRQNTLIPLFKVKETLYIACANPLDPSVVDGVAKTCGYAIELLLGSAVSITKALDELYGHEEKIFDIARLIPAQGPLKGLSFWRESERMHLNIPVSLKIEDPAIVVPYASPIDGYTRDISHNGTAIGLEVFLYFPKGVNVSLEFRPEGTLFSSGQVIKAKGEIVYCRMERGQQYFLGIRFSEIKNENREYLFKLASSQK